MGDKTIFSFYLGQYIFLGYGWEQSRKVKRLENFIAAYETPVNNVQVI
jgi:hypothetical protein